MSVRYSTPRGEKIAKTRCRELDPLVHKMYEDYQRPMSLSAIGRKFHRSRSGVRSLFERRGLTIRQIMRVPPRYANGQIKPHAQHTATEIAEIIRSSTKLRVPPALKLEWRSWSLARRGEFIAQMRAHLKLKHERPKTPFSNNVEPFDYSTPRAHEIVKRINKGCDSRSAKIKLDICSQGVIYQDRLWFWSPKVGYQSGPWTDGSGRPALHKTIWQNHHNRLVPKGCVLRFVDGNPNNLVPENLTLLTRNNVCRENQAAALARKSREFTTLLLNQSENCTHHGLALSVLQRG